MSQADDKCQGPSLRVQMLTGLLALWRMDSSLVGAQGHSCWAGWILGTVFVSKHTLSLLSHSVSVASVPPSVSHLLSPKSPWHPTCLPCPRTHPDNTCRECLGLSEPEIRQILREPLVLVTVGNGKQGFSLAEGCRSLGWLCPWYQEHEAFPLDKGSCAPGDRSSGGWMCRSGSWRLLEEGSEGAHPVSLGRGCLRGAGHPMGLMLILRACRMWGVPNPQSPFSSSFFLSPSSRFPQPGGPWLI